MTGAARRLASGGRIDRQRSIRFTLDGRVLSGFAGDTLASALLAQGARIIGRSFKYHRPRGFLSAGVEEPNGLFTLGSGARTTPNVPGTVDEHPNWRRRLPVSIEHIASAIDVEALKGATRERSSQAN